MRITNIAALHAPTGQARYGFDFAFEVDRELQDVDGVDTWPELIRGIVAWHRMDTRLLRRVIAAKAEEAKQPKTRTVQAPLRVMRDNRETRSA